jgi:hypothetical protein
MAASKGEELRWDIQTHNTVSNDSIQSIPAVRPVSGQRECLVLERAVFVSMVGKGGQHLEQRPKDPAVAQPDGSKPTFQGMTLRLKIPNCSSRSVILLVMTYTAFGVG